MFVRIFLLLQTAVAAGQLATACHSVYKSSIQPSDRLRVYATYFPTHCVGVTNMSLRYNLAPAVKIADIGV